MSMGIHLELPSVRIGLKPRPFFFPRVPRAPQTHRTTDTRDSHCGMSVVFPEEAPKTLALCLRSWRWVRQSQAQSPAVLAEERDCPDRSGDYTANPGLRPESTDPSLWGRMEPEDGFLPHPSLTGSRKHRRWGEGSLGQEMAGHGVMGNGE